MGLVVAPLTAADLKRAMICSCIIYNNIYLYIVYLFEKKNQIRLKITSNQLELSAQMEFGVVLVF